MRISDISSVKGIKIKLNLDDASVNFSEGILLRIEPTQNPERYLVSQYGEGATDRTCVLCSASPNTAAYLMDLFESEQQNAFRCMFIIEGVAPKYIEIQTYTFRSVTEYKTPVYITISERLSEATTPEKLSQEFVWNQLGMPALFCLNYKTQKKQRANIRFIGGKRYLIAQNTAAGIIADSISYAKEKYDIPVDIFVAPEIKFFVETDQRNMNSSFSADLEKISNPATYFARWEAYDQLSRKLIEQESESFGEIPYTSYAFDTDANGVTYEFTVAEELDDSYIGRELGAAEATSQTERESNNILRKRQTAVGVVKRTTPNKIITYLTSSDGMNDLPTTGVLRLFTAGDVQIMKRRQAARDRMLNNQAPLKGIVALIEAGASRNELLSSWGKHDAVTNDLKRNFPKSVNMNAEQQEALKIAVNTPDIAVIQGPPGTGKTTVIKAIAERFREIFEADQRMYKAANEDYNLRSPKILISSFQNEAVDNAISQPLPGDLPAFRKTAKRSNNRSREQYQRALDTWYTGLTKTISDVIEDEVATNYITNKHDLDDEFLSYRNGGETLDKASALIKRYIDYIDIPYTREQRMKAESIIKTATSSDDVETNPIIEKLEAQRLTKEAFEDDGIRNARKLKAYISINDDMDISRDTIEIIEKVCDESFSEHDFTAYVDCIIALKKKFCSVQNVINPKDKQAIKELILSLSDTFNRHYINTLSSIESKKSIILSEFLRHLSQDYESIVQKYSMTTAATCQTSLDLREGTEKIYDLVIIDEAARANPLDLFIPMSMGKRIVLVGDHKQLPHMLEPDVLKLLTDDPKFKDIPEIEKSLFERLFEMFSGGRIPKSKALTHQYRMHPDICRFVSESFYDGILKTAEVITPESRSSPVQINSGKALTFVDIPFAKGAETHGASKSRMIEVRAIGNDVRHILTIAPGASIGIITFYSAQVTLLRNHLASLLNDEEMSHVEIGTVDAFQGKEFDYVLLSCVRSNRPKVDGELPQVGFLEKPNRLCVAFSRSKLQLVVYGDATTLMQIPCFAKLYEICTENNGGGCYREY